MLNSTAQGFLAVAEWLRGRLAEAEHALVSSIDGWRAAGQLTMTAWGCYDLGQVQRAQGRLDAAVRTCQQALEMTATARPAAAAGRGPALSWDWPRWPTSATTWTSRSGMSPRASRCAGSSSTPRRWPQAW